MAKPKTTSKPLRLDADGAPQAPEAVRWVQTEDGRQLTLNAHGELFRFACNPGDEPELLEQLQDLAEQDDHPLTWYDAARLAHAMGPQIAAGIKQNDPDFLSPMD